MERKKEMDDEQMAHAHNLSKHARGTFGDWKWEPDDDFQDWDDEVLDLMEQSSTDER